MPKPYDITAPLEGDAAQKINENFDAAFSAIDAISDDLPVVNGDTVVLAKGTPVYGSSGDGTSIVVRRADADANSTMEAIGLAVTDIPVGGVGTVRQSGFLDLDTSLWNVGDLLYVSTTAGALTATAPSGAGNVSQRVAIVVTDSTAGCLFITLGPTASAHNLLSATHGDTTPAAGVRGDLIRRGATAWERLAITATAGRFVRSDGTDTGWSTLALPNAATIGDVPFASASNTLTMLADIAAGNALLSGGVGVAPSWGKVNIGDGTSPTPASAAIDGVLGVSDGGTGLSSLGGSGRILSSDGSTSLVAVSTAFNNRIILSQGTTAPVVWSGFAVPTSAVLGDLWYGSDSTTISRLAGNTTTTKQILTQTGTGTVSAAPVWQTVATAVGHALLDGSVHTDTTVQGVTRGSLITGQGVSPTWNELVIGAASRVLRSDGTDASWAQVVLTTDVTGVLPYANGGTNASTSWTAGSVLFAGASAVAQDNANLFWNDTSNRLGIGTTTPDVPLEVVTTGNAQIGLDSGATSASYIVFQRNNVNAGFVGIDSSPATLLTGAGDGAMVIRSENLIAFATTGNAERMRIDTSGNIGMGVTPDGTVRLQVSGGITLTGTFSAGRVTASISTADDLNASFTNTNATNGYGVLAATAANDATRYSLDVRGATSSSRLKVYSDGLISIGDGAHPTAGTATIIFADGTAPSGLGINTAGLYANDVAGTVEMFAIDEGGTSTQISPHNFTLFTPDDTEPFPWSYYARNEYLGLEINVNIVKLARLVQQQTGVSLIHTRTAGPRRDWINDQGDQMHRCMAAYEAWEQSDRSTSPPRAPQLKTPPPWLYERLVARGFMNTTQQATLYAELLAWRTVRGL